MEVRTYRGHEHPLARFSPEEAAAIRLRKQQAPSTPLRSLAAEFHCSKNTIFKLLNGYSYRRR